MDGELLVPDRFDVLQRKASDSLEGIIVPVDEGLAKIDSLYWDMKAAARGGFLIFRGESGSGKSTFLHTIGMFRHGFVTETIDPRDDITAVLRNIGSTNRNLRILVVEGREALRDVHTSELEKAVHGINAFLRSPEGERTLVVWPCNADDLQELLVSVARRVGGEALLGMDHPTFAFSGPRREQFLDIGQRTIAVLNQGASLLDLGVSREEVEGYVREAPTIGAFLSLLRRAMVDNQKALRIRLAKEQCKMWVVVAAGNDPDNDVAALTRGSLHAADIDRLLAATGANILEDLRRYPHKAGILGAVLDAKILYLPVTTALTVARQYGGESLKTEMSSRGLSTNRDASAKDRLLESDLGRAFLGATVGPRTRGPKLGSKSVEAFEKLADIASKNDGLLNAAIGSALVDAGLVRKFETEVDLGGGLTRYSDLFTEGQQGTVRLEVMWRKRTSRAEIANYTLTKLYNYGRAIGFLV